MRRGFLNNPKAKKAPVSTPSAQPIPKLNVERPITDWGASDISINKIPHAKLGGTVLPKDYKGGAGHRLYTEDDTFPSSMDPYILVSIPPKDHAGCNNPDEQSQWITRASTKARLVQTQGYPQALHRLHGPDPCVVVKTPTMGFGMFATRNIRLGELIIRERPLLVMPVGLPIPTVPAHYTSVQTLSVAMYEWEKNFLEIALSKMTAGNQKAYMDLANDHTEDGSGPLLGIARTNGYGIGIRDGAGEVRYEDNRNAYSATGKLGSRINHSCISNVGQSFDRASFSLQFIATRDIKKGEQIFHCYCTASDSFNERKKTLAAYSIVCRCSACVNATPETDQLRKELSKISGLYERRREIVGDPALSLKTLEPLLKLEKDLIKEGLDVTDTFPLLLAVIREIYDKLKISSKAQEYIVRILATRDLHQDT